MLNKNNNHTIKTIKSYSLSKEELKLTTYEINNLLEKVLDEYETFEIKNIIINKNNLYYQNFILKKEYQNTYKDNLIHIDENTNINNDLKEYTEEKIKRIINDEDYNNDIIFTNTLYFNYKWENNIPANYVSSGSFKLYDNSETIVEYMYDQLTNYMENDNAIAFQKDFENSNYSFIGIIPKKTGEFELSSLDLNSLLNNPKTGKVSIAIPKFQVETTVDLTELLPQLGIKSIFNKDANLTLMTNDQIKIDYMKQKIYLNIGEKGTTNTTAKNTTIRAYEVDAEDKQIYLNRPFAYMIINNNTNDVLFIGKIVNP